MKNRMYLLTSNGTRFLSPEGVTYELRQAPSIMNQLQKEIDILRPRNKYLKNYKDQIEKIIKAEKGRVKYWKTLLEEAKELILEAKELFEAVQEGEYKVDSSTSQPYRIFLERF